MRSDHAPFSKASQEAWEFALRAIDEVEVSETVQDVFEASRRFTTAIGGTSLLIGKVANPVAQGGKVSHFGMADWPDEYSQEWIDNDYVFHDPIARLALRSRTSFDWETAWQQADRVGRGILDRGRDFELKAGIAVPITAGNLPLGIVSMSYDERPSEETLARLDVVAIHAYSRMLRLLDIGEEMPIVPLTKREVDVLTFTAVGKTAWEIGKIYGIAESTVHKHLRNIIEKTHAMNKTHAVTIALRHGQILP
ncbi:MAG: helix-turn-helix transcriptional regulator [Litorimonas sp.]